MKKIGSEVFDLGTLDGEPEFDGYTASNASSDKTEPLFFDKFLEIKLTLKRPDLYYATSRFLQEGSVFFIGKGNHHPEYIACHPSDLEKVEKELSRYRTLIPLNEWKPTQGQRRHLNDALDYFLQGEGLR